jgi:SAM-dependent methyltransferase
VISWLNTHISRRAGLGLDTATQEPSKTDRRRNDVVVWYRRDAHHAFMTIELKTPKTPITDPELLRDACEKAQRWGADVFAIWNMQTAELYRTPSPGSSASPDDLLMRFPPTRGVSRVEDWLVPANREALRARANEMLDAAWDKAHSTGDIEFPVDPSVFVDGLAARIQALRAVIQPELALRQGQDRSLRKQLRGLAAQQGFLGFVDDITLAIAGQFCYRLVGQILFYFALRRTHPKLSRLEPDPAKPLIDGLRPFWEDVRRFDYEALFAVDEFDTIVPMPKPAQVMVRKLIEDWNKYNWNTLKEDVLGSIFERLIPPREQTLLGQFYTPTDVADFLVVAAINGERPLVLDPGCGSGTFLLRSYQYLKQSYGLDHAKLLEALWGFDISPFAAELAVINLFRQDMSYYDNFPRVLPGDFFQRRAGDIVEFPPARHGMQAKVRLPIPEFDAVIANPPYIRSQYQDDLNAGYKRNLYKLVLKELQIKPPAKTDLFAFFAYHGLALLKPGGRLAFVTSAAWLTAGYGASMQRFLLERFRLIAVVASEAESFFSQVDQNTVMIVAAKRPEHEVPNKDELIRFVTLQKRLGEIVPSDGRRWAALRELIDQIEDAASPFDTPAMRVRLVPAEPELRALRDSPRARNWSIHLRAPSSYREIFEREGAPVAPLEQLANVRLGYKSLQNQFFYVGPEVVKKYGIEKRYLKPITTMSGLDGSKYLQEPDSRLLLFSCDSSEGELRGTGALRYIRGMEDVTAVRKRQASKDKTIGETLAEQGGTYWYAPKATPHSANIWVRKAFDTTHAPFVFVKPTTLDQGCNFVVPVDGVKWEEVAAILTSSIAGLALEASGAASLGAGALEMPTRQLARLAVPDLRRATVDQRRELVELARSVWQGGEPVNWGDETPTITPELRRLDEHVLVMLGASSSVDTVYRDIRLAVAYRIELGRSKSKKTKASQDADLDTIIDAIVERVAHRLASRQFPESFVPESESVDNLTLPAGALRVRIEPFLGTSQVTIETDDGSRLLDASLPTAVASLLARALLTGRRQFAIPRSSDAAEKAISQFLGWMTPIVQEIEEESASSTLGTRFTQLIREAAFRRVGISSHAVLPELPIVIRVAAAAG